jgi:imidazolonepropionase-like amidohydrolase
MVADLLVVEGDPTLDLETLAEPRVVVQDGRVR